MTTGGLANPWAVDNNRLPEDLRLAFPDFQYPKVSPPRRKTHSKNFEAFVAPPAKPAINWRSSGAVPPARSQGACNACTSFAIVSVMETLRALSIGTAVRLAPGYIHTCLLQRNCNNGSTIHEALQAVEQNGVAVGFDGDYPFPTASCGKSGGVGITQFRRLLGQATALAALASGPVVGDMFIDPAFLDLGPDEIYTFRDEDARRLHSVAVVGYDWAGGYWIVGNSMGAGWGDQGFGLVAFGSGGLLSVRPGWRLYV